MTISDQPQHNSDRFQPIRNNYKRSKRLILKIFLKIIYTLYGYKKSCPHEQDHILSFCKAEMGFEKFKINQKQF